MLISEEHRTAEYRKHITDPEYGGEAIQYSGQISTIINNMQFDEVLDYGSGKGELARSLTLDHPVKVHLYDPAIPAIAESPDPREMVVCVEVLNHVEPDFVDSVLDDIKRVTKNLIFIAMKEDKPLEFWLPKIMERFKIQSLVRSNIDFYIIATAGHN